MKLKKILASIVAIAVVGATMSVCAFAEDTTVGVMPINAVEETTVADEAEVPAEETVADEAEVPAEETVADEAEAPTDEVLADETEAATDETEAAADETEAVAEETEAAADETLLGAGDTTTPTEDKNVNTGVEGIAAIAGVSVLAATALIISRKRK